MNLEAYKAELQQTNVRQIDNDINKVAYIPSNKQDRKEKHEKMAIKTFDEYRAYLEKIGL